MAQDRYSQEEYDQLEANEQYLYDLLKEIHDKIATQETHLEVFENIGGEELTAKFRSAPQEQRGLLSQHWIFVN